MSEPVLQAWCNGYDVVAALDIDGARGLLSEHYKKTEGLTDVEELEDAVDGDGIRRLEPTQPVTDDDGTKIGTVQSILDESPEPRHLWSCDQ